jgi:prepilin-type N-terminal cleavage/methylation domain-containing protein
VVRQRSAKPPSSVQFRPPPPAYFHHEPGAATERLNYRMAFLRAGCAVPEGFWKGRELVGRLWNPWCGARTRTRSEVEIPVGSGKGRYEMKRSVKPGRGVAFALRLHNSPRAFTLIELMIVILIIGILVGIAVLAWVHSVRAAADKTRLANMKSVVSALNLYRYNTEHFPPNMDNDLQRVGRRCRRRLHP